MFLQNKRFRKKNITQEENSIKIEFEKKIEVALLDKTRPDTRPIPVADGWAGAEMRVFTLYNSITITDGPTDERTDGRTKPPIELRVRNLKNDDDEK